MKKTLLAAAACSFDLSASSSQLVLIPEGEFHGIDGRPFDAPAWILTPALGQTLAQSLNQRSIDMVIDYEHATLKAQKSGEPAPAAGWLKAGSFTYIDGVGLCSTQFKWTDKAQGFIQSEEYKYLSPVFLYKKNGEIVALLHTSLTNTPNLDQLPEAKLAAAAQDYFTQNSPQQDSEMEELLEQLRWMLNLPLSATAEEIMAELSKLQAQIKEKTGVAVAANSQNLFDAIAAIDQIKLAANSQTMPDPAQFVPMSMYKAAQAEVVRLSQNGQAQEQEGLIQAACSDGRLLGVDAEKNAHDYIAKHGFEAFKDHVNSMPKIPALTQRQTEQVNLAANHQQYSGQQHTPEALNVAAQMGIDLGAPQV